MITLSQFEKQTNDLVKMVYKYSKYSKINNIRFWIKPHPSIPVKLLRKWWRNEWPKQFRIVEDDISHLLPRSNILISGMSSVCLEAVALGVPLIVVENISGLRFNSLPEGLPKQMWQNCQSDLDINNSINYFRSRKIDQNSKMAENIKENYFEKVTIKSVSQFIGEN